MRKPTLSPAEIVQRLSGVFRLRGYEGATLSELSKATGLQRASLYHFYPNGKEDMANAVLDQVHALVQEHVVAPLRDKALIPAKRLQQAAAVLEQFYQGGGLNCTVGVFTLSASRATFQAKVNLTVREIIGALADCLMDKGLKGSEAKLKAQDWFSLLQGSLILARNCDEPAIFDRTMEAFRKL